MRIGRKVLMVIYAVMFFFVMALSCAIIAFAALNAEFITPARVYYVATDIASGRTLNQAIKAIAIARGFVAPSGKNLVCIPAFTDIMIDGEERTAIKLIVEAK